ncbi:MAG: VTT domain-containing protein [Holosporales bacterium]|jgi:membrane protein DedA with SNARE-associated domain|nr:VTT domain-containing protein [Holosporales bacterium]
MFAEFAEFVKNWGYIAVLLGAMIEGESIVLTASALAAGGFLSIYKVFWISLFATVFADQVLFWCGYKLGTDWLVKRFPKLEKARERGFSLLKRMDVFFIFVFRFIYGIRIISPIVIGSAHIKPSRFAIYNAISGFFWALVICSIGYAVADVIIEDDFDTKSTILIITGLILIVLILIPALSALIFKIIKKDR